MTDEPQPELRWAPREPKPANKRKVWLISGLAALALAIVVVFLVFVLPGAFPVGPTPSPTSTRTPSAAPTTTTTPSPTPTTSSEPTEPPQTPPPVPDPDVDAFAGQVRPWLDDAVTGLQIASETSGEDAASVIEPIRQDAERLSDTPPPSSISAEWSDGVSSYLSALSDLQDAYRSGSGIGGAEDAATAALQNLRDLVEL
ncbi:hypothetical protein [Microbacterium sp. CIAB417]|uniref:hypothetical protein n=1 Tax=Microbacterium sp. CIAB417 TaxID=2860287 RepID=UPI001FACD861|nr:hypothetical protein [Microbacterium sp. CIAB417]